MGRNIKIPIKWMPPESIHDQYYDQKSDVVCLNCNWIRITIPLNTIINILRSSYLLATYVATVI